MYVLAAQAQFAKHDARSIDHGGRSGHICLPAIEILHVTHDRIRYQAGSEAIGSAHFRKHGCEGEVVVGARQKTEMFDQIEIALRPCPEIEMDRLPQAACQRRFDNRLDRRQSRPAGDRQNWTSMLFAQKRAAERPADRNLVTDLE
ncbi:hypothetical protein Brsp07_04507 [Brucella sp. NBRC 14130]